MSTARRLTRGLAATLLQQVVTAVGNLVLVPVFLGHWGEQRYGEWLMLYAAVAYMTVVDFGMQMYVVNRLNQAYTRGAMDDYHRTLHSALRLSLAISGAVVALVVIAFALMPVARWLEFVWIDEPEAALVGTLLGVQLLGAIPQGLVNGVYRTLGEYPRGVMISNAQRALGFGLTALVVAIDGTPSGVAAAQLAPLALSAGFVWWDLRRRHPEIRLGVNEGSYREARALLVPSLFFFLIQLSSGLILQGTTLVVGSVISVAAVVGFTTTRTLANLITQITFTVNATLWPDLTTLETQGRYDTLRELQRLATKVVLALTLAATVFLVFDGEPLVRAWTRGKVDYDATLTTTFLVYTLYLGFVNTTTMVLVAANQHRATALTLTAATGAGIALAIPAAHWLGSAGVTAAMLVTDVAIRGVVQTRDACRMIAQPLGSYLMDTLARGALVAALAFAIMGGLAALSGIAGAGASVIAMIAFAGVTGVVVGGLTFVVWLAPSERRRVLSLARRGR